MPTNTVQSSLLPLFLLIFFLGSACTAQESEKSARPRVDSLGDPLPEGALARMGSARLQIDGPVAFLPGSDMLITARRSIHLLDLTGKELKRIPPKQFLIQKIAVSPNGKTLAAFGWDKTVRLVDLASGKDIASHEYGSQVYEAAFVEDGMLLLSAEGQDHNKGSQFVRLRETVSGKEIWRMAGKTFALSPDQKTIALLGAPHPHLRFHEVKTGREIRSFSIAASSLTWSPDGKMLALTAWDGHAVRIWDVLAGKVTQEIDGGRAPVSFSPDSKAVAYWTYDGRLGSMHVAEVATGAEIIEFGSGACPVRYTPDGKVALAPSRANSGMLALWDTDGWKERQQIPAPDYFGSYLAWPAGAATFSPDGRTLVTVDRRRIHLWDVASGKERAVPPGHTGDALWARFDAKGETIVSAGKGGTLIWSEAASGKELRRLEGRGAPAALSTDQTLAAWIEGNSLIVRQTASGKEFKRWEAEVKAEREGFGRAAVAFAPDGTKLAWGRQDNTIVLLEIKTGAELHRLAGHETFREGFQWISGIVSLAFTPDSKTLASSGVDLALRTWDVATGKEQSLRKDPRFRLTLRTPEKFLWMPDGKRLLLQKDEQDQDKEPAKAKGVFVLLDPAAGKEQPLLETRTAFAMALSPDGKTLAYVDVDDNGFGIVLVHLPSGKETRRLPGHHRLIHALSFSSDGTRLASASEDGTVLVWEVAGT